MYQGSATGGHGTSPKLTVKDNGTRWANLVPDPPYVLFVESDRALRERVGQALRAGGFVPLLAGDGHDALDYMAGTASQSW